jgi:tRNA A37 N6-isopentenylltransferase MiaA
MVDIVQSLALTPLSLKDARRYVEQHHRHNRAPQGGLFAVEVKAASELAGVAIIGRPVARMLDDGATCEVTRLCTNGSRNCCSLLYGASARAARALGYRKIITYTLASEPGTSLKASGWKVEAEIKGQATWSRPSRDRVQTNLFGEVQRPPDDKVRWSKTLS